MKWTTLLAIMVVVLLTGCATDPFAKYYQSYTNQMPAAVQQRLLPPSPTPQIITTSAQGYADQARNLEQHGLVILGTTSFWGFNPTREQLLKQAKAVAADVAIWASEYSHTEQGLKPILSWQPEQTYTTTQSGTVSADVYGTGGYGYGSARYSGTSTTTAPGALTTQYIPYQQRVYQHGASFWRRTKPPIFGANFAPIPDALRATLQRNTGAYVRTVMTDSPAFKANIMQGDIVVQIADTQVTSWQQILEVLPSMAGGRVSVKVLRGTQTLDIEVNLNSNP